MWWLLPTILGCAQIPVSTAATPVVEPPAPAPAPVPLREPTEPRYAATELLVAWDGALDAPPGLERTRAQALARARELRERALAGEDLAALAREHSDEPLGRRGGRLGVYLTGTMDPAFERAVAAVAPGSVGPVADTPFGFYVVRRDPVGGVHVGQIQVSYAGSWRSKTLRTRTEADALIADAVARLAAGEELASVAADLSEKGAADADLGVLTPGQFIPAFEEAALALPPHGRSAVVESPYGLHVVVRLD